MNCPVCGAKIETTSGVCPMITGWVYDKDGKLIDIIHTTIVPTITVNIKYEGGK